MRTVKSMPPRSPRARWTAALVTFALLLLQATPVSAAEPAAGAADAPVTAAAVGPVWLVGAGDIARCDDLTGARATAALIRARFPTARVFTAGDNAYPTGSAQAFADCYAPTWGAFRSRTRAAAGNHDWMVAGAAPYRTYFGASSRNSKGETFYAYTLGAWRVIVLDTECDQVGGCGPGSRESRWLAAELRAHPRACTVAITHRPLFSSGMHGSQPDLGPLVRQLVAARVDLLVSGHDHDYERFARQTVGGMAASVGIRQFVVGTGGGDLRSFGTVARNSKARIAGQFGVLALRLSPGVYSWKFITAPGGVVADSGTGRCR
jgi:acid phosphatase type 7